MGRQGSLTWGTREGYSWAEIAARLGVTRQAAQQRWGGSGRDFHSDGLVGLHRLMIAESARFPELALILHSSGDARHIARLPSTSAPSAARPATHS